MAARDPDPDHHPALRISRRFAAAPAPTPLGSRRSEARRPVRGPNEAAAGRRRSSAATADGPISRNEFWVGEPVGIRTRDLLIKSQLLYQLSYGLHGGGNIGRTPHRVNERR